VGLEQGRAPVHLGADQGSVQQVGLEHAAQVHGRQPWIIAPQSPGAHFRGEEIRHTCPQHLGPVIEQRLAEVGFATLGDRIAPHRQGLLGEAERQQAGPEPFQRAAQVIRRL